MGFNSVFKSLQEVFPQVDVRILKAFAIEHSKDANAAVEAVIYEVLSNDQDGVSTFSTNDDAQHPSIGEVELEKHSFPQKNPEVLEEVDAGSSLKPSVECEDAIDSYQTIDAKSVNSSCTNEALGDLLVSNLHDGKNLEQDYINTESGEQITLNLKKCQTIDDKVGLNQVSAVTSSSLIDGDTLFTGSHRDQSCSGTKSQSEDHYLEFVSSSLHEEKPDSAESEDLPGQSVDECKKPVSGASTESASELEIFATEMVDVEAELSSTTIITQSGLICRTDLLEDTIKDAKNNKKILFSVMESVINMMREVELQEKAAEEAKEEAAKGGLAVITEVENLKEMLQHAKEANEMHAGEVFGEKAILATEMRELQYRLLHLANERDKSLATLEEMRQTLEARLNTAEEEKKEAERQKIEKEECAMRALAEQKMAMEMVVQESKKLQQEAEENSKLREFLIDHGHTVDTLQGEIGVICENVRFLKEKSDECIPISKALSSSHLSSILPSSSSFSKSLTSDSVSDPVESFESLKKSSFMLASSSSSFKSMTSDRTSEQPDSPETPKKTSPEPSIYFKLQENSPKEKVFRTDGNVVASDDEWDLFEDESLVSTA